MPISPSSTRRNRKYLLCCAQYKLQDKDRKRREEAARNELEKRRERFLFNSVTVQIQVNNTQMVEMRDGKKAFDERDMKLAFMYAVPDNIQEEEKRMKEQKEDAEVERFKALYLNPRVVEDTQKETQKEEEEEAPPPRVWMALWVYRRCRWPCTRRRSRTRTES